MVRRASEEMKFLVDSLNVWSLASRAVALADMDGVKLILVRWVDINRGILASPEYWSRLVVDEVQGPSSQR